jgi:endoglucanase
MKYIKSQPKIIISLVVVGVVLLAGMLIALRFSDSGKTLPTKGQKELVKNIEESAAHSKNPLSNHVFYNDTSRKIHAVAVEYAKQGKPAEEQLLRRIADQPGTTWLTGPSTDDPAGDRDIAAVVRTSREAASQKTVPIYQLYAIPNRDACASHSKGGFKTQADYLTWIGRIIGALETKAVIAIEADAIAHTVNDSCLSIQQIQDRYKTLSATAAMLERSPKILAAYLDAGHPDWLPNPAVLVEPLRASGISMVRGISTNVSFYAETKAVTTWSQRLVTLLGGDKGVIIDTSRNGQGISPATGEARWCNPQGRGLGPKPTTIHTAPGTDAYFWGKNVGESDGTCFGHPQAGVFDPELALELARNAVE